MSIYCIGEQYIKSDDFSLNDMLVYVYMVKMWLVCVCCDFGIEMYIVKVVGKFVIKWMFNLGGDYVFVCDFYELLLELFGFGQVMGIVIQEDFEEGLMVLKFDFLLIKVVGRLVFVVSGVEIDSVKIDGNKFMLCGMLYYLWEEVGFNCWVFNMVGK